MTVGERNLSPGEHLVYELARAYPKLITVAAARPMPKGRPLILALAAGARAYAEREGRN